MLVLWRVFKQFLFKFFGSHLLDVAAILICVDAIIVNEPYKSTQTDYTDCILTVPCHIKSTRVQPKKHGPPGTFPNSVRFFVEKDLWLCFFVGHELGTKTRMIKRGSYFNQQLPDLTKSGSIVVFIDESCASGQICFHFFFLRSPGIAFMRISEMGAAMFIMHVDRHFPI